MMRGQMRTPAVGAIFAVWFFAFPLSALSSGERVVSDGVLRVSVPRGWSTSVAPGWQGAHRVAWILAGDLKLGPDAAAREGGPPVSAQRVLVAIGDFVAAGPAIRWPAVGRLVPPRAVLRGRQEWWRVRFAGRALAISLRFGSRPTPALAAQAEMVLASVTR
jgi:hypothetical protein